MLKKTLKFLLKLSLLAIVILGLFFAGVYYGVFGHLYTEKELKEFKNETASLVLSDNGDLIGKFFAENRTNIQFNQLPTYLVDALVATEDARYFEHEGIDSRSLFRVLIKTILLQKKSAGGGSTITQQLAKNMYGRSNYGPLTMPVNKVKEIILANRLEKIYSKEGILTLYLNTVPFGENVLGIESASRRFFNKSVKKLTTEESAVLIGMLKANTYYNPRLYPDHALNRRNIVLNQMAKYDYLSQEVCDSLQQLPLKLDYANLESEGPANYFLVQVKKEVNDILINLNKEYDTVFDMHKSGLIIETTLNLDLQNYALEAFKSHLSKMQKQLRNQYKRGSYKKSLDNLVTKELARLNLPYDVDIKKKRELFSWDGFYSDSISVRDSIRENLSTLQAGFLAMEPKTGAIKTWIGGIDFRTQPYDQIFAQRQTASAFKPVLYVTAIENGAQPCEYLDNDPIVLTDFSDWQPQNYDKSFGGNYSIAASLAKSLNIPTVNLYLRVPFETLETTWKNLGFSQTILNKPATALGTTTASLYEMTKAFSSFANGGYAVEPKMIVAIKTSEGKVLYQNKLLQSEDRILKEESTILLNAILQKAIHEGTGASMKSTYGVSLPLAGKTGTSQDYADAWFIGYNPKLVLATRVGASLPSIHFNNGANGSGSALALPLVAKTLYKVQNNSRLRKQLFISFQELPEGYDNALNCEDYLEDSAFESFIEDIFSPKSTTFDKAVRKAERKEKKKNKRSFLDKVLGRNKN